VVTLVGWITLIKSLFSYSCRLRWKRDFSLGSFTTDNSSVHSYFARPRRLPDLWRIQIKIKLASIQQAPSHLRN